MALTFTNRCTADMMNQQMRGNWKTVKLIDAYSAAAGETVVSPSEEISLYRYKSLKVNTTGNCTVRYQFSPDDTNWFDPDKFQDATPTKETYVVNADSLAIALDERNYSRYIRIVVTATAASVINVWLEAQM